AQAEIRGEVAQGSHGNLLMIAKVDRPKQGDKPAHLLAYALSKVGKSSFSISRIAFMTLSAFSGRSSCIICARAAGTICQKTPNLSVSQPHCCVPPPSESLSQY